MIHASNISKQYGNKILYKNGSFQVNTGEKIGLVGPNGAGKTTIFRILADEEGVDGGTVSKPDKLVLGYFSQNIEEMKGKSALEEVKSGVGNIPAMQKRIQEIEIKLAEPMDDDQMQKMLEEYGLSLIHI